MQDLELAKLELKQKALSLVVTKGGKTIFETSLPGVKGFIQCIKERGKELDGASVADRVVGKPIALLCVYSGVVHVFAALISMGAMKVLDNASIPFQLLKMLFLAFWIQAELTCVLWKSLYRILIAQVRRGKS